MHTKTQSKEAVTPQETEPKLPASVGSASCRGMGQEELTTGMGVLAAAGQKGPPWHKPSWSSPLTL